jgi:aminoglycoside N3'-acetyltransferase
MTVSLIKERPQIMDVLRKAAEALAEQERLRVAVRTNDTRLTALCRLYDAVERTKGIQPYHLRTACEMRGVKIGGDV